MGCSVLPFKTIRTEVTEEIGSGGDSVGCREEVIQLGGEGEKIAGGSRTENAKVHTKLQDVNGNVDRVDTFRLWTRTA